jgi:hypothetical protein
MFIRRQQPAAVLGKDGHECGNVPLVPGAIVNGELGYRVYSHPATVTGDFRGRPGCNTAVAKGQLGV